MSTNSVSKTFFVTGIIIAILVASVISVFVTTQLITANQGEQGPPGSTGPKGDTGVQGIAGSTGAKGDTGATGDTGAKGDMGVAGPQGEAGKDGAIRQVITGSFDITKDGDIIQFQDMSSIGGTIHEYHWKRIDIPQISLTDRPIIQVYTQPYPNDPSSSIPTWQTGLPIIDETMQETPVIVDEGCIYIQYKIAYNTGDLFNTRYMTTGEYYIILII